MHSDDRFVNQLRQAGLTDKAARIYAYLLQAGGAYPSTIAAKTHLNRSTVYLVLAELGIQGLVNEVERGKKLFYSVAHPNKLLSHTKHAAEAALKKVERVSDLMDELVTSYDARVHRTKVRYFDGVDAVIEIYNDHMRTTRPYEMLSIANSVDVLSVVPPAIYTKYRAEKVKKKITTRGILPPGEAATSIITGYRDVPEKYRPVIRYLEPGTFPLAGEIKLYRDDAVSIIQVRDGFVSGVIIEDQAHYAMMRAMYELAWKSAKPNLDH